MASRHLGSAGVGGILAAAENASRYVEGPVGEFTAADIAFLDEIAETILPETKTPGAKAAKTGAFMALMVTDSYWPAEQKVFREGMRKMDEAMKKAKDVSFMQATPAQRLAVLTTLDREQKRVMDARDAAERREKGTGAAARGCERAKSGSETAGRPEREPAGQRRNGTRGDAQEGGALLPHDERARDARLLHVRNRLHESYALRRGSGPLRSVLALHTRRAGMGRSCLMFRLHRKGSEGPLRTECRSLSAMR